MASTVTVDFNASLARFTGAIDKATSDLNRFQRNADRIGGNVNKVFTSIGAGLSVGVFGTFIKSSIDAADKLKDLSKSTGISVEQLSGLQLAAKQSGTDLEGVSQAINKLSVNIGKDSEKFAKLGITAKDPLEAFKQLADVFVAIKDPQERAAVAAQALGKSWASAAPLLSEGGKEIGEIVDKGIRAFRVTKEMTEQADKFNGKLDELKISVQGVGIAMAGDLLPHLNTFLERFIEGRKITGSFFEGLDVAVGLGLRNPFDSAGENIKSINSELDSLNAARDRYIKSGSATTSIDVAIKKMQKDLEVAKFLQREEALALGAGFENYKIPKPLGLAAPNTKGFLDSKKDGVDKIADFIKSLKRETALLGATDGQKRLFDAEALGISGKSLFAVKALSSHIDEYKQSIEAAKIANKEFDDSFADYEKQAEAIESVIGAFRKQNEQIAAEADLIGATNVERETAVRLRELEIIGLSKYSSEWEKAGAAIKKASEISRLSTLIGASGFSQLKQDQEDAVLLTKAFTDGITQADGSLKKLSEAEYIDAISVRLGLAKDKVVELDTFAQNAAKNIQDSFADFLFDPFKDGLDGMLKGFGQTIQRMVAEAVAADLARSLFGDLAKGGKGDGLLGEGLKFLGGLLEPSAKGNVFSSPGLSAYSGQIVSKPTLFPFANGIGLMGEAGPEAILPLSRGSDGKLGVAGGGNITNNVYVSVSGTNNAPDMRSAAGQVARTTLAALSAAQRYT